MWQAVHVLHSRLKKAAFFDIRHGVELIDEYEGEHTIVGYFADGDYVVTGFGHGYSGEGISGVSGAVSGSSGFGQGQR